MEKPYSRELIDAKLDNILLRIEEVLHVATEGRDQALKTNGRVNKLEDKVSAIQGWRLYFLGAGAIITFSLGLIGYIYTYQLNDVNAKIAALQK